ncbi:hypothetical protein [uncultured Sunxiuqinia sp.]|uniref:hypothetical protein n=1 Tax=uncultured Sunxiuqinia sp. TaxID=1573825 RepID=UPI00261BC18B|nr:hypothetical protein [uncultured Sunxiuqinia sp.]
MKKLVLVLAIVFAFGVTYAGNAVSDKKETKTEQVSTVDKDKKEKKTAKTEKKEDCATKSEKKCCSKKTDCGDKK